MFFANHLTTKAERDAVMATSFKEIEINPADFHGNQEHKPIVWEEGSGRYYDHNTSDFFELLKMLDEKRNFSMVDTKYFQRWSYKGSEIETRLRNLPALFNSIKENGVQELVSCEATGQRLDGSYRTKIAKYLGIKKVKAKLFRFRWQDIDETFVERLLNGRWLSHGKEYYEFEFAPGIKNIPDGGDVYRENAKDRWDVLKDFIKGETVLDLGCNEGYMAIQCALAGKKVFGCDIDYIHGANTNKLIFEWVRRKKIGVNFVEMDARDCRETAETVLMLNMIYHVGDTMDKLNLLARHLGSNLVLQCNLRKEKDRGLYLGSHPDDLVAMLKKVGYKRIRVIDWRDKPIVLAK